MENLLYKCDNLPNRTVTNGNAISWIIWKYVCTNKTPAAINKPPTKNVDLTNYDVINGNDISAHDQAHECHEELT